jgi:hypothetical protein
MSNGEESLNSFGEGMITIVCYQCPCTCDFTSESRAVQQAHTHAREYGHNVGVYASESLGEGMKREVLAVVLKSCGRAA